MEYKTLKASASAEFVEQRSRFICNVMPVSSEQEAISFINKIKQQYWDAKHNVYAYILKVGNIKRYSDDGEPHSTAGLPVLDTMSKSGLFDCVAVVTRYFGGVLLGTGGLVRAYSTAAKMGVEAAGISIMKECFNCSVVVRYTDYGKLEKILNTQNVKIKSTDFNENVSVEFSVAVDEFDAFEKLITESFFGSVKVKKLSFVYDDF